MYAEIGVEITRHIRLGIATVSSIRLNPGSAHEPKLSYMQNYELADFRFALPTCNRIYRT